MILFLILLILAMAALGLYAAQNTGTHDVSLWNYHWTGVAEWVPVVVAAGVVVVLFAVYMVYAGARAGMRQGALGRRIATHEATLADLRRENQRLREENARLKSQLQTETGPEPAATAPLPHMAVATARSEAPAQPPVAPPYQPQPGLGERVRAFLSGREPAS